MDCTGHNKKAVLPVLFLLCSAVQHAIPSEADCQGNSRSVPSAQPGSHLTVVLCAKKPSEDSPAFFIHNCRRGRSRAASTAGYL